MPATPELVHDIRDTLRARSVIIKDDGFLLCITRKRFLWVPEVGQPVVL